MKSLYIISTHWNLSLLDPCESVMMGVRELLADQNFYKTSETEWILKAAEAIIQWAKPPYSNRFIQFSQNIIADLQGCFTSKKNIQAERECLCT